MKKNIIVIFLTALLVGNYGCQDVLDKYPLSEPSDVTFLQNDDELVLAINGAYRSLWFKYSELTFLNFTMDCMTDIAFDRGQQLFVGADVLNSTYPVGDKLWQAYYKGIVKCNFILTNMNRAKENASETVYNQVEGQALFLRAYWYYQLVALFGDVPLITEPQDIDDSNIARTAKSEIVDLVLSDLDIAASKLPLEWSGDDNGRVTKGAALALKARVALYNEKWEIAAQAAKSVMDLGQYELYDNYENLFYYEGESCSEVIFEIVAAPGRTYSIETTFNPGNFGSRNSPGAVNKVPSQQLVDAYECTDGKIISKSPLYDPANPFENRDPRLKMTIAVPGEVFVGLQYETHRDSIECWDYRVDPPVRIPNQDALSPWASFTGYAWKKYCDIKDFQTGNRISSSLNCIALRYAEVLLTYAEAKIELNQIDQSVYDAINAVRSRPTVNMPDIAAGKGQAEMRKLVRRERKIELALEGHRLFDIYRWKIADKCLNQAVIGRPNKPYNYSDQGIPEFDENDIPNYEAYMSVMKTVRPRTFNDNNYLWAIPQHEMDINNLMTQNPGY